MAANVTVNGDNNYADNLTISTSVTLGVAGLSGSHTYLWSIVDQPPNVGSGAQAVLSSSSVSAPTFTPSNTGTYLVQCVVDSGTSVAQALTGVAIIRQFVSGQRIPAANESLETDGTSATEAGAGWAIATNSLFRQVDTLSGDPGVVVGLTVGTGLAVGDLVSPSGSSTNGSPTGLDGLTYPGFAAANASSASIAYGLVGVIIGSPSGGSVGSANAFVRVRWLGLYTAIQYTGSAPTVGAAIYATNDGILDKNCLSVGSNVRRIGVVAAVNTGTLTFDVYLSAAGA